jgi:hypothetical protein
MKLYIFLLLVIIILSLVFGVKSRREGFEFIWDRIARQKRERAAERARIEAIYREKRLKMEYGGVISIQKQLELLRDVKKRVKQLPKYQIEPKKRKEINESLDIVINSLQTWLTNRIQYLKRNNATPTVPADNASIDGLRKIWLDNGLGIKVLVDGIIDRLNLAEDQQSDIVRLLQTFITNMNIDFSIVISDSNKSFNLFGGDFGELSDSAMKSLDNIFSEDLFAAACKESENLTYEEQYST